MEQEKVDTRKYWIKLEKDFLNSKFIKIIKDMDNGTDYILFYLALMLESVDTVGHLRLSSLVPYNEKTLASLTDTNIDIVRSALKIFTELGMVTFLEDGTIFLPEVPRLTGKESESAERVRRHRLKQKQEALALQCNIDVTNSNDNKEEEEDKQEDEYKKNSTINYRELVDFYHKTCPSLPKVVKLSDTRKGYINALLKEFSIDEVKSAFEKVESCPHLIGKNDRGWKADFEWLIKKGNLLKVLEGRYYVVEKQERHKGSSEGYDLDLRGYKKI